MKSATVLSLTAVLALFSASINAAPISSKNIRLTKRGPSSCPERLQGPSGRAFFAFKTGMNNKDAMEACASCYGGVLADVNSIDMELLDKNPKLAYWIKARNGDNRSESCLTLTPTNTAEPDVIVGANCASQNQPLCVAGTEQHKSEQRLQARQDNAEDPAPEPSTATDDPASEQVTPTIEEGVVADGTGPSNPEVTSPRAPDSNGDITAIESTEPVTGAPEISAEAPVTSEAPTSVEEPIAAEALLLLKHPHQLEHQLPPKRPHQLEHQLPPKRPHQLERQPPLKHLHQLEKQLLLKYPHRLKN
ncbi:hypothetical protein BG011_006622 [Mortierella polycephala]|uniref:Uncharacterized protein n=1 Tax=Mortierella polycephala TaxID=41804 RepID=A0A9P6PS89_9FUNG|nr:hypothetical protein BG011_006622 [Mortierella polycephala]